jgi:hypothetical protein
MLAQPTANHPHPGSSPGLGTATTTGRLVVVDATPGGTASGPLNDATTLACHPGDDGTGPGS